MFSSGTGLGVAGDPPSFWAGAFSSAVIGLRVWLYSSLILLSACSRSLGDLIFIAAACWASKSFWVGSGFFGASAFLAALDVFISAESNHDAMLWRSCPVAPCPVPVPEVVMPFCEMGMPYLSASSLTTETSSGLPFDAFTPRAVANSLTSCASSSGFPAMAAVAAVLSPGSGLLAMEGSRALALMVDDAGFSPAALGPGGVAAAGAAVGVVIASEPAPAGV